MSRNISIITILLLVFVAPAHAQTKERKHLYPIPDVLSGVEATFFSTQGFVIYTEECPPCPPPNQCKPCRAENHIIIADTMQEYDVKKPLVAGQLLLRTNPAQRFEIGHYYIYLIQTQPGAGNAKYYYVTDYQEVPAKGLTNE